MAGLIRKLRNSASLVSLLISAGLIGCTIRPTPVGFVEREGYKSDISVAIAKKVRCEARNAMVTSAARLLSYSTFPGQKKLRDDLIKTPDLVKALPAWDIDPIVQVLIGYFTNSTLGLTFELDIQEQNTGNVIPEITPTHGPHPFTLGFGNNRLDLIRKNKRTIATGAVAIGDYQFIDCDPRSYPYTSSYKGADFVYPMRGNIQFDKSFDAYEKFVHLDTRLTYFEVDPYHDFEAALQMPARSRSRWDWARQALSETYFAIDPKVRKALPCSDDKNPVDSYANMALFLQGQKECSIGSNLNREYVTACYEGSLKAAQKRYIDLFYEHAGKSPANQSVADEITFTTKVENGLKPSISFDVAGKPFRLSKLPFELTAKRDDIHKLTASFVLPTPTKATRIPDTFPLAEGKDYSIVLKTTSSLSGVIANSEQVLVKSVAKGCPPLTKAKAEIVRLRAEPAAAPRGFLSTPMSAEEQVQSDNRHRQIRLFNTESDYIRLLNDLKERVENE